jgi:lipid A 3-O-deacylase
MYGGDSRRARRRRLHIGLGCRFGGKRSYEVGYRFQHMSNAGIKRPNAGMNFHQLRVQYHF